MATTFSRALKYLLLGVVVVYFVDWIALEFRVVHGNGVGKVTVSQYLATPLKGQKEEYDYLGSVDQPCVKAIFPHNADQPCWWLERHKHQWQ